MINKIASLLNGIRELVSVFDNTLIDVISSVIPWLAPLLPAFLVIEGLTNKLHEPIWYGLIAGAVLEGFGLASISTAIDFWSYNQNLKEERSFRIAKRKEVGKSAIVQSKQAAPFILSLLTVIYYFLIILALTVVIEIDSYYIHSVIKALLSSTTLGAGLLMAMRIDHKRKVYKIGLNIPKDENRKVPGNFRKHSEFPNDRNRAPQRNWRKLNVDEKQKIRVMSTQEIASTYGITERSARNWKRNLKTGNL